VHQGELGGVARVRQVREERLELPGGQHALVGERAGRQGREVDPELALGTLAQPERPAVQVDARELAGRVGHDQLAEERHRGAGGGTDQVGGHLHVAPGEHVELLLGGDGLDRPHGGGALVLAGGQEGHADRVAADGRQLGVDHVAQERVRDLREDAGAVAGVLLGADRAAVVQVEQRGEPGVDDVAAGGAAQRRHEGEAAGVVLRCRVVQPGGGPLRHGGGTVGCRGHQHRPHDPGGSTRSVGGWDVIGPGVWRNDTCRKHWHRSRIE
jgi:hypothetical protein